MAMHHLAGKHAGCRKAKPSARTAAVMAVLLAPFAFAAGPSSVSYSIPISTLNAGADVMMSSSYVLLSSLGDAVFGAAGTSASYRLTTGLWNPHSAAHDIIFRNGFDGP